MSEFGMPDDGEYKETFVHRDEVAESAIAPRQAPPPGQFGGADGKEELGVILTEAMMAAGVLHEIAAWRPPARLPSLRPAVTRRLIAVFCRIYLRHSPDAISACSEGTSISPAVEDVLRFLGPGEEVSDGITVHRWEGAPVLALHLADGGLHLIAQTYIVRPAWLPAPEL